MHLSFILTDGGALDRLLDDQDAPAKAAAAELDLHLGRTSFSADVDEVRPDLEAFRVYVLREIEREKAQALADKLARQLAKKCGIGYQRAQSFFLAALDRLNHDWPDEGGW